MKYIIVHFNTPKLTTLLCYNINKFDNKAEIVIFENSNKFPIIKDNLPSNVKILDNRNNEIIKYENIIKENNGKILFKGDNFGSAIHSMTIQWFIDNLNEPFFLLDSDVFITRDLNFLKDDFSLIAGKYEIRGKTPRISPYVMYINPSLIKLNKLNFFDPKRIIKLNGMSGTEKYYDTGASLYEDIIIHNLPLNIIKEDYYNHLGAGSYLNNEANSIKFIKDNMKYWK